LVSEGSTAVAITVAGTTPTEITVPGTTADGTTAAGTTAVSTKAAPLPSSSDKPLLSGGAIAGIAVEVIFLIILGFGSWLLYRRNYRCNPYLSPAVPPDASSGRQHAGYELTSAIMANLPTRSRQDYKVRWICVLSTELTTAMVMLDEEYPPLSQHAQDDNLYTLGRIGEHNVVIACLSAGQMGNNSAATVTAKMRYSFGSIRFGLMVGIGEGVPSEEYDIRLGDVVVSKPGKQDGGVIQYDFGRTIAEGRFVRNGSLNAPPAVLLNAVNAL
jgi:hypothetical protein